MSADFLGGGVVFALAAVLWVVYLIPSWLRRRHFGHIEAASQHATSSSPGARLTRAQRRDLRRDARGSHRRAKSDAHADLTPEQRLVLARHRRKTQRLFAFLFLLVALATVAAGVAVIVYLGEILVLVAGIVASLTGMLILSSLSSPATVKPVTPRAAAPATTVRHLPRGRTSTASSTSWTPQSLPLPLQASPESASARTIAREKAAEGMRRALAEQAYLDSLAPSDSAPSADLAPTSGLDALGRIGEVDTGSFNLDQALRRRRAG